ncbi:MAG: hypothetical protein R3C11_07555 [Planctomycetaceae bacterium]
MHWLIFKIDCWQSIRISSSDFWKNTDERHSCESFAASEVDEAGPISIATVIPLILILMTVTGARLSGDRSDRR